MSREQDRIADTEPSNVAPSPRADYLEAEFDPEVARRAADASARRHAPGAIQRKPANTTQPSLSEMQGIRTEGKTTKARWADMDMLRRLTPNTPRTTENGSESTHHSVAPHLQMKRAEAPTPSPEAMHAAAAEGVATPARLLPHAEKIQASFGPAHDVSQIRAHIDPESTRAMGAEAYATGNDIVFANEPDEELAAHEAAHVMQQAHGVNLKGGVGEAGDAHEQAADAVAMRVKAGESSADLLGSPTAAVPAASSVLQQKRTSPRRQQTATSSSTAPTSKHHPSGATDPLLVVESRELHFPKTVVGGTSSRSIVLRNADTRPIALDGLVPLRADLFHEVQTALNSTIVFQPGDRREIAIQFRPARAARVENVLQVITGFGPAGPATDIHVRGEGIDVPYDGERSDEQPATATSSGMATEIRIEEQQREIAGLARTHDQLAKQRAHAVMYVDRWRNAAAKYNHSIAQWTLANWIDFLGKTGGNHVLHGSAEIVDGWKKLVTTQASGGIKKGMGEGGKKAIEYAKKSAKLALVLEYPLFGLAINHAIDKLADFIIDKIGLQQKPEERSDEHALEATKSTGQAGVQKTDEILGYESRANLAIEDTASAALVRIARADSAEELEQWQEWANAELSNVPRPIEDKGRQFSDVLLRHWVLEHAGSTRQANASTNPKAWAAARDDLRGKGMLGSLERTDLFIHQCRLEWGALGLVDADQVAAQLDAERLRIEASARQQPNSDTAVANQVRLSFGADVGRLLTFHRTSDPKNVATVLGKKQYQLGPEDRDGVHGLRIFGSEFTLGCRIFLHVEGNGVIVKRFSYDVRGLGHRYTGIDRLPGEP